MKVVTDKGEGDKYKKNLRDLIIFFSKKARTLLFYILFIYSLCGCYRRRDMFVC